MAVTTVEKEYARLRSYLNPAIRGPNTDAILWAMASANASHLINNVAAVNDQLYIVSASGTYLDERLAQYGISRPPAVGLSDEVFSKIGIQVKNRKQVRDLINNLLDAIFGNEFVRATNSSSKIEPYNLADGDNLTIRFDDRNVVDIIFTTSEFSNIAAATAQEVADAISKALRNLGLSGAAIAKDDGGGGYIEIISDTIGASSSVTILGGSAQNEFQFPSAVPAGGNMSTQWTVSVLSGGIVRFTWTGGANPQLGKVSVGNYVNIFGGGFASSPNEGSYTILNSVGGSVGSSYFEISNPLGASGIITQGTGTAVLFYNPVRRTLSSNLSYAALYQTNTGTLEIFLPAATKVVRRERVGSAHIHDPADPLSVLPGQEGPFVYDIAQPFTISSVGTTLNQNFDGSMSHVIQVADASQFPDQFGYLIFGYGTQDQEGPVPYISRPSSNTLLISPAYDVSNSFAIGTDISLVALKSAPVLSQDGTDYPFYVTDVVSGRQYAESLIQSVAATGINIVFHVLYPNDIGLGKWGSEYTENPEIWG